MKPASARPPKPNSIEPPWYGPVCPVVWEGRHREAPPYPDLAQIAAVQDGVANGRPEPWQLFIRPQVVPRPGRLQPLVPRRVSACPSVQHPTAFSQQRLARVLHGRLPALKRGTGESRLLTANPPPYGNAPVVPVTQP